MSKAVFNTKYLTARCFWCKCFGLWDGLETAIYFQRPPERQGEEQTEGDEGGEGLVCLDFIPPYPEFSVGMVGKAGLENGMINR